MSLAAHVNERASAAHPNPSDGQRAAGNYRKGHVRLHGLDISIENPRGSYRTGVDAESGKPWRSRLPHHYGYLRGTEGGDGDHVDVFLGPHLRSPAVYVIDQRDLASGDFDEHKCMIGFASEKQARKAYCDAFSDGRGKQRIAHVEGMSMEKFKNWLKGDTKAPIKRAEGGRVGYAEGGAPAFDPNLPVSTVPAFDPNLPTGGADDAGALDAFVRGAGQGATYNLSDEMAAAHAAGPRIAPGGMIGRTIIGGAMTAADKLRGRESETTKAFDERLAEVRKGNEAAKRNRPLTYGGGELAGMIPAVAAAPEAGAVKALAPHAGKMARFGAEALDAATQGGIAGGLAGAGEGTSLGERAMEGAKGIVSGIVGGGLAAGASGVARAAYDRFGKPIVGTVRGWMNPDAEAARRTVGAIRPDQQMIQEGAVQGLTPQQWAAAHARGEPVKIADLGAGNTQSLLRSSANTSPEARSLLEGTFEGRFHGQSERVGDTVRNILPGGQANARKTADQLVAEYDAARSPLYKKAYEEGDQQIFTPAIDRLTGSDIFSGAMKRAISSGKDRAINEGYGSFTPAISVSPSGAFIYGKPGSGPVYPNLQYWDQVKRELDVVANMSKRSGDMERYDVASRMAKTLRGELDQFSPSYAKARGVAADYFGEKDALEAGRALAGKKPVAEDVSAILRKMDPKERELFREGYASDLAERVIGRMKDTQDVTKAMFNSPNERKLAATVFGPGGMAQLQARMALETIMNGARNALGNSTTARQLIEAGLAGGAISGYASGWDVTKMGEGAAAFATARGAPKYFAPQAIAGMKHFVGKVDARTARRVAELLTSDDPRLLREGYRLAADNEKIRNGLFRIANSFFRGAQGEGREPFSAGVKALQGPVPAHADEQQNQ